MIYGEILAGGKGTRFGNNDLPKQYMMLQGKPIIIHTIEQFVINEKIDRIVIVCPEAWIDYTKDIIRQHIGENPNLYVTVGGSTRNESIISGCRYIRDNFGLSDDDFILTHDAVRPFVNQRIIDDNIAALEKFDGVDTVIPAYDTIIDARDGVIDNIPDRKYLYDGQTPQSFRITKLMNLYDSLSEQEKEILTDACKIFVLKNEPVGIVMGESYNIKITTVFDLKMAAAITEMDNHVKSAL
ncbi:MAG: 2-C-methyl-D-erythritol 4-phosphate cytidylyltransferase [Erysipelotrichaceae bacterium]|nr:2-C-methyl-D-erythritol 4-phosphate cytidylyltransferase [Erysipelotrichaceae bacterium]MBR5049418.1 2-C-methyl-D-erythritol 4-phosphate cytidylyltransferase [Erysipelotrichaceae bacterium]